MNPLTWPQGLYDLGGWIPVVVGVIVALAVTTVTYRCWVAFLLDPAPDEERPWLQCVAVGAYAGLCWPWLLCFGVPVALGVLWWWTQRVDLSVPPRPQPAPPRPAPVRSAPAERSFEDVMAGVGRR
jgi:hypothetical protein